MRRLLEEGRRGERRPMFGGWTMAPTATPAWSVSPPARQGEEIYVTRAEGGGGDCSHLGSPRSAVVTPTSRPRFFRSTPHASFERSCLGRGASPERARLCQAGRAD